MNIIICIVITFPAHPSLSRMTTYCRVYYSDNDSDNDSVVYGQDFRYWLIMTNMAKYPKERQCLFCLNGGNKREKNLRLFSDQVKARDMNRADSAFAWLDKRILSRSTNIYFCVVYDIDMMVYFGVSFHPEYKLCALWVALHYTDALHYTGHCLQYSACYRFSTAVNSA